MFTPFVDTRMFGQSSLTWMTSAQIDQYVDNVTNEVEHFIGDRTRANIPKPLQQLIMEYHGAPQHFTGILSIRKRASNSHTHHLYTVCKYYRMYTDCIQIV